MKKTMTLRTREPRDCFDMASLSPRETGLPFVVFILQKMGRQIRRTSQDCRQAQARRSDMLTVAIRPTVRVLDGDLSADELELLTKWVDLNRDVLVRY